MVHRVMLCVADCNLKPLPNKLLALHAGSKAFIPLLELKKNGGNEEAYYCPRVT